MNKFSYKINWQVPDNSPVPEDRFTCASLELLVDNTSITKHENVRANAINESVTIPLYPLAEWMVKNWWALFYEKNQIEPGFEKRHNIKYSGSGYSLPDFTITPESKRIFLQWRPLRLIHHQVNFIESGKARVDRNSFYSEIRRFVSNVITRLEQYNITDSELQREWKVITEAQSDEVDFCKYAGTLGLDPYSIDEDIQDKIIEVHAGIPEEVRDAFFEISTIENIIYEKEMLDKAISYAQNSQPEYDKLVDLKNQIEPQPVYLLKPWEQGYAEARLLRSIIGLNGQIINKNDIVEDKLGVALSSLFVDPSANLVNIDSNRFSGLLAINKELQPGFAFFKKSSTTFMNEQNQRFTFSRVLREYLFDNSPLSLIRESSDFGQKRNKAFAAEFLAPAETLRKKITVGEVSDVDIAQIAEDLNVSSWVVKYQIQNNKLATIKLDDLD